MNNCRLEFEQKVLVFEIVFCPLDIISREALDCFQALPERQRDKALNASKIPPLLPAENYPTSKMEAPKFLTATQAANLLGVDRRTVQRWVDANRFPGTIRTAGGHRRIPLEALEHMRGNYGRGKALLYLRVAEETQHRFLERGLAHLTQYALQHQYSVAHVVQEVGPGLDGSRPELESLRSAIQGGEPGYEVILVERTDRLLLLGGDEFIRWAAPWVRIEVAGASCPKVDALALYGVPPARVEQVISKGRKSIAEALGLLRGKKPTDGKQLKRT